MQPLTHLSISACPICGKEAYQITGSLSTFVRAIQGVVTSEFSACRRCDFAFMNNPFDAEGMSFYYSANDQYRRDMLTIEESCHLESQLSFISRYIQAPPAAVLEIGPDNGAFLARVLARFPAVGYFEEFNLGAKARLKARGYLDFSESAVRPQLTILRHVLEHIAYPSAYLRSLRERMDEHGAVFIEVPDCSNLSLNESDTFQMEHVNYFSLQSMIHVAAMAGYQVLAAETSRTLGYSTTPNRVLRCFLSPLVPRPEPTQSADAWEGLMRQTHAGFTELERFAASHADSRIAIYGAGTRTLEYLANRKYAFRPVAVYDCDPKKVGTDLFNCTVANAGELDPAAFDYIVIMVVGYAAEVETQLREKGVAPEQLFFLTGS